MKTDAQARRKRSKETASRTILRLYPELLLLEDPHDRCEVFGQSNCRLGWRLWAWLLVFVAGPMLLIMLLPSLPAPFPAYGPIPRFVVVAITSSAYSLTAGYALLYLFHRPRQRLLRQRLVERGIPVCVNCGYDLRGQTEPRCPECGTAFDPELLQRHPVKNEPGESNSGSRGQ